MHNKTKYYYDAPLARLFLTLRGVRCHTLEYEPESPIEFAQVLPDGAIRHWLDAYFSVATMPAPELLDISGTPFQQSVYRLMLQIPHGQTLSYGAAAKRLGSAPRAVGQACKRNPLPLLVPCHRIVGQHDVGGYEGDASGYRVDRKKWLLNHESKLELNV